MNIETNKRGNVYAVGKDFSFKMRNKPYVFSEPSLAKSFAYSCKMPMRVVLMDCPTIWVVCPSDANKLENAGYEVL